MTKYPECADCYFHDREPTICDECEDADQYEPEDDEEMTAEAVDRVVIPILAAA